MNRRMLMAAAKRRALPDPYFANVSLLLHMDGSNGGTTFTDVKGHAFTANGSTTSTASPKFGSASLLNASGQWIDTPNSTDFAMGSGDFTVECSVKTATSGLYFFGQCDSAGSVTSLYGYVNGSVARVGVYIGGTAYFLDGVTSVVDSAWHHIAFTRAGGTVRLFQDGVLQSSGSAGGTVTAAPYRFSIGRIGEYGSSNFVGNIDEFRLTKGVARYTANFTPPAAAFPDY